MQWLGTTYTTIFNLRHSSKEHLFQGRFKSILVENEPYLMQLSYYIHRNPLRAGIAQRLRDYPWSSYPAYAYKWRCPDWLKTDLILSRFGPDSTGRKAYREKIKRYADEKKSIWEDITHGIFYGSKAFVDRIKRDYLSGERQTSVPDRRTIIEDMDLGEIIEAGLTLLNTDIRKWKSSRRISKSGMIDRDMLVYHLWQSGRFSNSEIGTEFGLTTSSISRRVGVFQALLDRDKKLQAKYGKFRSIIKA